MGKPGLRVAVEVNLRLIGPTRLVLEVVEKEGANTGWTEKQRLEVRVCVGKKPWYEKTGQRK